jgi:hypothetical protein
MIIRKKMSFFIFRESIDENIFRSYVSYMSAQAKENHKQEE